MTRFYLAHEHMNSVSVVERQEELKKILGRSFSDTVFIHSDLFRASLFVQQSVDRQTVINNQIDFLVTLLQGKDLWFPAFNYQFPKTKIFNVTSSLCEVGPLPEYFRTHKASWRTFDPMFSASGTGLNPSARIPPRKITAFDQDSIFGKLVKRKGEILFYGAGFLSATILHYAEQLVVPLYRYDKIFSGSILYDNDRYSVEYTFHARPLGQGLDYSWDTLFRDLRNNNIVRSTKNSIVHIVRADILVDYWIERLHEDPFYFLDESSKKWVVPKLEQLGRRFQIEDFE